MKAKKEMTQEKGSEKEKSRLISSELIQPIKPTPNSLSLCVFLSVPDQQASQSVPPVVPEARSYLSTQ